MEIKYKNYRDDFKNLEKKAINSFAPEIKEKRCLEQYFLSKESIEALANIILNKYITKDNIEEKVCLICLPTLANYFYDKHNINIILLDIDKRFDFLPGFTYYDINNPIELNQKFEFIISDPPFFAFSIKTFSKVFTKLIKDPNNCIIIFSWLIRYEKDVIVSFKSAKFSVYVSKFDIKYSSLSNQKENNICFFINKQIGPLYFRDKPKKNKVKIKNNKDMFNLMKKGKK